MKISNSERKLNNKGFSLIELIVVVAVMVITVAAATVTVSMLDSSYVEDTERAIKDYIGIARTKSMSVAAKDWHIAIGKEGTEYYTYLYKTVEKKVLEGGVEVIKEETTLMEKKKLSKKVQPSFGIKTDSMVNIDASNVLKIHFDAATGKICKVTLGGVNQDITSGIGYIGLVRNDYDINLKLFYNTGKCERE